MEIFDTRYSTPVSSPPPYAEMALSAPHMAAPMHPPHHSQHHHPQEQPQYGNMFGFNDAFELAYGSAPQHATHDHYVPSVAACTSATMTPSLTVTSAGSAPSGWIGSYGEDSESMLAQPQSMFSCASSVSSEPASQYPKLSQQQAETASAASMPSPAESHHSSSDESSQMHECHICGKEFQRNSDLTKHRRYHTREFACLFPSCNKSFATGKDLKRHEHTHKRDTGFRCPVSGCGKARSGHVYNRRDNFIRHLRTRHAALAPTLEEQLCGSNRQSLNRTASASAPSSSAGPGTPSSSSSTIGPRTRGSISSASSTPGLPELKEDRTAEDEVSWDLARRNGGVLVMPSVSGYPAPSTSTHGENPGFGMQMNPVPGLPMQFGEARDYPVGMDFRRMYY